MFRYNIFFSPLWHLAGTGFKTTVNLFGDRDLARWEPELLSAMNSSQSN